MYLRRAHLASWITLCLALLAPIRAAAGGAGETTCALIVDAGDRAGGQLAAVVQTKVAAVPETRWVEREAIDRVVAEQKVAAALGPENSSDRIALGRLLKADVLVMLRPTVIEDASSRPAPRVERADAKPPQRAAADARLDVVVAETRSGLRLLSRTIGTETGGSDSVADAVLELVSEGIRKAQEPVRGVCAVPPFVGKDLTYEFEHLKSAYAQLIEQSLLEQTGIVVVEIAEARSIAAELARTGGGNVARPMPVYLLGEYRNNGSGDARTQSVKFSIKRGEKELESRASGDIAPDKAAAFVRDAASRVVAILSGGAAGDAAGGDFDLKRDAQQLAERAAVHRKLASWDEAAALTEAALLLTPDDDELHRQAVIIYGKMTSRAPPNAGERTAENVHRRAAPFFRGLEHLEIFLRTAGDLDQYKVPGQTTFVSEFMHTASWTETGNPHEKPEPWRRALAECASREREVRLRIAHMRAEKNRDDDSSWVIGALWDLPEPEQYQMIWDFLIATRDLPGAKRRAVRLPPHGFTTDILDRPEGRKLLTRMKESDDENLKSAAATLERQVEDAKTQRVARDEEMTRRYTPTRSPTTGPAEIVFKPIRFRVDGSPRETFESVDGLIPAGDKIDFAWIRSRFFVIKQKDVLRLVTSINEPNVWVESVDFDGRYVWVAARRWKNRPMVLVIDPIKERTWEMKPENGLPLDADPGVAAEYGQYFLKIAGVEPGVACIAGAFGRTWVAIARLDPKTGPSAKVFHEATESINPEDKEQWRHKALTFVPMYAVTLGDPKTTAADKRVLIGRADQPYGHRYQPLVINPATLDVDVLEDPGPWHDVTMQFWTVHDGALYWAWPTPRMSKQRPGPGIYRIGMPDLKQTLVASQVYDGEKVYRDTLIFYDGRVHLLARDWWCADALDKPFRRLSGDVPNRYLQPPPGRSVNDMKNWETERIQGLLLSNHYGLLAQVHRNQPPSSTCQVIFPGS